jgi:hypothetical protein
MNFFDITNHSDVKFGNLRYRNIGDLHHITIYPIYPQCEMFIQTTVPKPLNDVFYPRSSELAKEDFLALCIPCCVAAGDSL